MTPNIHRLGENHEQEIQDSDNRAKNARFVDEVLVEEMLKLSVKDRNDIQEEIHGVKCLAMEETPELLKSSLQQLEEEIDRIPDSQKQAYLRSFDNNSSNSSPSSPQPQHQPSIPLVPETPYSSSDVQSMVSSETPSLTYIHGDEFRLRFLRCDLFDARKAAKRMMIYLEILVELFGDYALQRPICLSDFSKDELKHFRKGMMQILPYRDRSGRRIMIMFPEDEISQIPPEVKAKIAMYLLWVVGDNDIVSQQKGIIVLIWFDGAFAPLPGGWKIKYKFTTMNCDRVSGIHGCSPDTPYYRLRRSIMTLRAGEELRRKLIFHLGESMEIHYKLQGYGIPFEHVPISWTGKVKVQYLKQWIRIRQAIEHQGIYPCGNGQYEQQYSDGSGDDHSTLSLSGGDIIECPQLQDVVFRQGTSGTSHPGNVTFRSLIESTIIQNLELERRLQLELEKEQERLQQAGVDINNNSNKKGKGKNNVPKKIKPKRPKQLANDIYEERQRNSSSTGRFLIWNNEKGWWNELTDREQICMKIEYMVREFQKFSHKAHKNWLKNRTSRNRKDHPCEEGEVHSESDNSRDNSRKNIVYLNSQTSLFQAQDGSDAAFANKRQRLNQTFISKDGGDAHFGMECFGKKFTPCTS